MSFKCIRDFGVTIGELPTGPRNTISDVPGVTVGHYTLKDARHNTGITVILPAQDNLFLNKLTAACCVLNGFGKTLGLMQIEELGTLETPIALTNTLNVGRVHDALVQYSLDRCSADGYTLRSVNPLVCECNDSDLNDISDRVLGYPEVMQAIEGACEDFAQGDVGAGAGTTCHSLKGGIGSASRVLHLDGKNYTLGALVQTNHGRLHDLSINGQAVGQKIEEGILQRPIDQGSCIVVIGTDLPLSDRQLRRVLKRSAVGLARVGSYIGHGSGEVIVGFTTANRIRHTEPAAISSMQILNETLIDCAFRACIEAVEEAILNSLAAAQQTRHGETIVPALRDLWKGVPSDV